MEKKDDFSAKGSPGGLIAEALKTIRNFITETTGQEPSDEELADALKRYFVLNEIKCHILMARRGES